MYRVEHTVDGLGGRLEQPLGWDVPELAVAIKHAETLTREGKCGYVRRADGAVLLPDGSWSEPEAR